MTLAVVLPLLGAMTGCGASKPESALHKEQGRIEATACWNRGEAVENTTNCAEEMQKVCEAAIGSGSREPEEHHIVCEIASNDRAGVKKKEEETPAHTPEEEERRSNHLKAYEKAAHEEEALERTPAVSKVCEEEKRTQEKLRYENPGSSSEPQREAEYEKLCHP